jgi:hypothetical protein
MASEITEHDQNASPSVHDDGNGSLGMENRGVKRARAAADDDDDDDDKPGRERRKIEIKFIQDKSRRHITFSKRKAGIMKKVRCQSLFYLSASASVCVCVSARAACSACTHACTHLLTPVDCFHRHYGKNPLLTMHALQAYELSVLTGTQVLLLVVSETGLVYTFTTPKLQPLVTKPEGKNLIQVRCNQSPDQPHGIANTA